MDVKTASPAEIDTAIAEIDERLTAAWIQEINAARTAKRYRANRFADEAMAASMDKKAAKARAVVEACTAEVAPYHEEFLSRGGWRRAFIVPGGHVHSSQVCSTCNNGTYPTRFGWLPELSGHDEAEIVDLAGARACTVCYPSAPVETAGPSRLFHADEVAAEKARSERAEKAAAKEAKRLINAVGPIKVKYDTIKTVQAAKMYLTSAIGWNEGRETPHPSFPTCEVQAVAAVLAEKLGTTPDVEIAAASKRAANRK